METSDQHYTGEKGQDYFDQRESVLRTQVQTRRADLFMDLASDDLAILDFGCGNGGLLSALPAAKRIGVEISEPARMAAANVLDTVQPSLQEIDNDSADLVISHHALEHVANPAAIIQELVRVLKPGGTMRIVVPCEMPVLLSAHRHWKPNIDQHFYTWSPLHLGNLLKSCGLEIENAHLSPKSTPGRVISIFMGIPVLDKKLLWLKSILSGKIDTVVTTKKPSTS